MSDTSESKVKPYKDTLNLPVTRFDMKANLATKEPLIQERWREIDLYGRIRAARAGRERKVLHDGPPYANGEIHMGHLLNKVLKDVVVRSLTMRGYDSPYVPGWDCHGLPIEHKVVKDLGSKAATMEPAEIRDRCRTEALKWVDVQREQFQRLGASGDWNNPYLTLDPRYEASVLEILADLVDRELLFRKLKPIHWCLNDRTALAEAELEYRDATSPSIYVNFAMVAGVPASWGEGAWHAMIWTTTPWTLPANVAIAAHPRLSYSGIRYVDPDTGAEVRTIVATELVSKVLALRGIDEYQELGRVLGKDLEHAEYRHPFIDRIGPIVLAEYVSAEDGTGLVHTAPGHGTDDFKTGNAYGLATLSPVDGGGRFTSEAPEWLRGEFVFKADPKIVDRLRELNNLFYFKSFSHSYPHCWRCKKPVIFRATEQWFVGIDRDDLRGRVLGRIAEVNWLPAWGRTRIESMVAQRPDWCVSRQRHWGVPIPAFSCESCNHILMTAETIRRVRDVFRDRGADAWYRDPAAELLAAGTKCPACGSDRFRKENDILDVWFESGSSWRGVLSENFELGFPAYLYLEGSDQHRGWFQSSLVAAVATVGSAPFENVLTHGFIVDDKGEKMSKSEGNSISAVKSVEKYGADVLRLYVASMDYSDDVRIAERGVKEMSEAYRKIRNTFRYLLGNLEDYSNFDPSTVPSGSIGEIDRRALAGLNRVIADVRSAYENFEFYRIYQRIYQYCSVDLSSFYLDVLKDRLYAERRDGAERRAARFVMHRLFDALTRLLAPIIPHTAEELWGFLPESPDKPASVHLALFPEPDPTWDDPERDRLWDRLLAIRDEVLRELEKLRAAKRIGGGQEATVVVGSTDPELAALLAAERELLETICIVSELKVSDQKPENAAHGLEITGLWVAAQPSPHPRCERCWNHRASVGADRDQPTLCERCVHVLAHS